MNETIKLQEKEMLSVMYNLGYLNDKGLKRYVSYLLNEIKDWQNQIDKTLTLETKDGN